MSVTFVQKSVSAVAYNGTTLSAHASAAAGDQQLLFVATHASVTSGTPTGWTLLSRSTSSHSALSIFTRTLGSAQVGSSVSVSWSDYGRAGMRTYRGAVTPIKLANGLDLVSPAETFGDGVLVRVWASAQPNDFSRGTLHLITDPALVNADGDVSFTWYGGLAIGDDPAVASAPSRTATSTVTPQYPQWVDVFVPVIPTPLTGSGSLDPSEPQVQIVDALASPVGDSALAGTSLISAGGSVDLAGGSTMRATGFAPTGTPAPSVGAVTRWVLTDEAASERWVMPINPDKMTSPYPTRAFSFAAGTKAGIDRVRTFQQAPTVTEWEWEGVIRTPEHYEGLEYWAGKDGAVLVTDHLGRTFEVVIQQFEPTDRRPMATVPWRLRYVMRVLILSQLTNP